MPTLVEKGARNRKVNHGSGSRNIHDSRPRNAQGAELGGHGYEQKERYLSDETPRKFWMYDILKI